jgi:hypothetical protein
MTAPNPERECAECKERPARYQRTLCNPCRHRKYRQAKKDPKEHNYGLQELPEGFHIRGVSQMVDGEGKTKLQWIKSSRDPAVLRLAQLQKAVEEFDYDSIPAKPATQPLISLTNDELLAVYPMGDPHTGMYSWAAETGQSFDLKIARRNNTTAFNHLVNLAPPTRHALLANLGDFFHSDNPQNRTVRSGHALDVDSRYGKVMDVGLEIMFDAGDLLLTKHDHVTIWCLIGNHDDVSSQFLARVLKAYYRNEPRVTVNCSPSMFLWYRFGQCLLGGTHGHTVKKADLGGIMACDRPVDWGETKFRHWYTGHVHHDSLLRKEFAGCTVETLRTLAPRDAWHNAAGYRAGQDMKLDIWHKDFGLVNRHVVGIERIWEEQKQNGNGTPA